MNDADYDEDDEPDHPLPGIDQDAEEWLMECPYCLGTGACRGPDEEEARACPGCGGTGWF